MIVDRIAGDVWGFHERGHPLVITTNIGWDDRGRNNMGAGLALDAMRRWSSLPLWYGEQCRSHGEHMPVVEHRTYCLLFLPVKPLLVLNPSLSWNQVADPRLICRGLGQLALLPDARLPTVLTFPGCGNGGLAIELVEPLVRHYLECSPGRKFLIVDKQLRL